MAKAKKAATKPATTNTKVFNLLARGQDFTNAVREALSAKAYNLKSTPGIMYGSLASNQKLCLPIPEFAYAWTLDSKYLQSGRVLSIIGQDGVGKTTLVFTMFGWWIPFNIPCAHVEVEGKPMAEDRIKRCLHSDKKLAEQMFNTICWMQAFEFKDMVQKVEAWLKVIRDKNSPSYVPDHIPAGVAVDTASKLMDPKEAVGYQMYAEEVEDKKTEKSKNAAEERNKKKKEEIQELGSGSNLLTAKLTHQWCRRLAAILTKYNAILIWVRHQNEKVDMTANAGGGTFVSQDVKDTFNRTAIGGKAMAQNAAWEIILTREKLDSATVRGERVKIGQFVKISVAKNSYGALRNSGYELIMVPRTDTDEYQEPAIDFSPHLARILKFTGLLKVSEGSNGIECPALGVSGGSDQDLNRALHNHPEVFDDLCIRLGMTCSGPNFKTPPSIFASEEAAEAVPETLDDSPKEPKAG